MDATLYQTDPLLAIQQATSDHLAVKRFLAGIPVILADQGDVLSSITQAVAKLGICIIIEPATAQLGYSGPSVQIVPDVKILVWENVIVNRGASGTRKRASAVMLAVVLALAPKSTPTPPVVGSSVTLEKDSEGTCIYSLSASARLTVTPTEIQAG